MGGLLTSTMRNITTLLEYTRGGRVVARQVAFIGFVGMLSGQRVTGPSFSVTVNTRFYPGKASLIDMLTEAIYAIKVCERERESVCVCVFVLLCPLIGCAEHAKRQHARRAGAQDGADGCELLRSCADAVQLTAHRGRVFHCVRRWAE